MSTIKLRPYQEDAINNARNAMAAGKDRVLIRAPTGAGKTVIAGYVADSVVNKGFSALFVVERRTLVKQTHAAFAKFGIEAGIIMAGHSYHPEKRIQVASVDTIRTRADELGWLNPALLFTDEAHLSHSDKYNLVRKMFPQARELGLTATPARKDGKGLGDIYDAMVETPDYQWFIENGYLVQPLYVAEQVSDLSKLVSYGENEYTETSQSAAFESAMLIGEPVKKWEQFAKGRPTMFFGPTVAAAKWACAMFNEAGIPARHIDAFTKDEERQLYYKEMAEGKVKVLTNYGVLDRGVDMPFVSCIMVMREVKHISNWIQIVGRGLRPFEGKEDCIVIDLGHNVSDRFGCFVDYPVTWTLDETEEAGVQEKEEKESKQPKQITCGGCGFMYVPSGDLRCPLCGMLPQTKQLTEIPETYDTELGFIKPKAPPASYKKEVYGQLLGFTRAQNWKDGSASHAFKEIFGHWPSVKRGVKIAEPHPDIVAFMVERDKKYWKSIGKEPPKYVQA